MDKENHTTFAERTKLLRETASTLRDMAASIGLAAETVMTEVLHMDAAAKKFTERAARRSSRRNMPEPTRWEHEDPAGSAGPSYQPKQLTMSKTNDTPIDQGNTARIRQLNDTLRTSTAPIGAWLANGGIVITRGIAELGNDFMSDAIAAVRTFDNFTPDNDPHGEHDMAFLPVDGVEIFFKIDYYDRELKWHSPDASDPGVTRRVLTIALAEEYWRMTTPYDDEALRDPQDTGAMQLKQCVYCAGITAVPQYEEGGICDFCGKTLPWHPIEL
jgi:hypothetical protein